MLHLQNDLSLKTSQASKHPNNKTFQPQNVPDTKRTKPQKVPTIKCPKFKTSQTSNVPNPKNVPNTLDVLYFSIKKFNNVHKLPALCIAIVKFQIVVY